MKIVFICEHNRFRSKLAEAYFNKLNKNKKIKAQSMGIFKGNPLDKNILELTKELSLKVKKKRRGLEDKFFKNIDTIIIVATKIPKSLFKTKAKKILTWKIEDTHSNNKKQTHKIAKLIENKVKKLLEGLK